MDYRQLKANLAGLGMDVDRTVYWRRVDRGWTDKVQGVAFNIVSHRGVRIFADGDRGTFFQKPGPNTTFATVDDACDWIWRDVCFHVAPHLLTDAERQQVIDEAHASIEGRL